MAREFRQFKCNKTGTLSHEFRNTCRNYKFSIQKYLWWQLLHSPICDQLNRARVDHCQLTQQMTFQPSELHPNLFSSAENIKYMIESINRATDK